MSFSVCPVSLVDIMVARLELCMSKYGYKDKKKDFFLLCQITMIVTQ